MFTSGAIVAGWYDAAMHDPKRDPFYEGLWADVQEGIDAADRGDLLDGEDVFAELLGEKPAAAAADYEADFALWVGAQAAALREGRFADVDVANVTDELEGLVNRDRREIRRRLTLIAMHLLRLEFQPEIAMRSWRSTIRVQARAVEAVLADSPSLRSDLPDFIAEAYADARKDAAGETDLPIATFPLSPTPGFERALAAALAGDD